MIRRFTYNGMNRSHAILI